MVQVKNFDNIIRVKAPDPVETPVPATPTPDTGGDTVGTTNPPATADPGQPTAPSNPSAPGNPVINLTLGTKLISSLGQPKQLSSMPELSPAGANVLQCVIRADDTYLFSTQASSGTNGARDPYETCTLSRMKINGDLVDSMKLLDAGHGTSFVVEKSGSSYYIWFTWLSNSNQLMRFLYKPGTYTFSQLVNASTLQQFETGYNVYNADWDADLLCIKHGRSSSDDFILRRISEFRAGTNITYGKKISLGNGPPTLQGFCTVNGTLFRWVGAANGEKLNPADPAALEQYSWATGQRVDRVLYPKLGVRSDTGQFRDNNKEPESSTMWRDSKTGLAQLTIGVTTGLPNNHRWPIFTFSNLGDKGDLYSVDVNPVQSSPVQGTTPPTSTPTPTPPASFVIGQTKPTSSNVGLLAGSSKTSLAVVNGNITVTADNTVIRDKYVKGRILVRAKNVKIINCYVGGGSVPTGTNTAMIDCNSSSAVGTVVTNCVLCPDTPNLWVNGIIGHDYTIRYCDIYNVVDGCGVYENGNVNTVIEANYIHDLAYFTNDPNHSDNHTHNDGIQMQGGSNLVVRGNNVQAFANPNIGNYSSDPFRPAVTGQAFAGTPNVKQITDVTIELNWMDGGANTITVVLNKFAKSNFGVIRNNRFGRGQNSGRVIVVDPTMTVANFPSKSGTDTAGNVYENNGSPVKVWRQAA